MSASPLVPHLVVIAVSPGVDALDVTGPAEVFAMANQVLSGRHGQSQFSVPLAQRPSTRQDIRSLRRWIGEHLDSDLSVPALAVRMAMSERHFARVFHTETGSTPGAFVEQMRLEAARRMLERTDRLTTDIARTCGFGSVETLYRVVRDRLGTTPGDYRDRFRISAPA
ncbi:helix-turn-helix domain-containing protein [Streptomyces sp. H10-C2]|uniref:helix-turn-helix domain-containing protein n=1 Tax=unclassified Streptomyces TaxID=2593676 RepID=UPI0024B9745E|nr:MULTISPECIES: helix-turn-helix domain-containing protein [unclassified Streptomyces]MDJ0343949.1 helix-turn-helix domain-containing protein [Streptomyces sp. PH10-H1]MDJ0373390.1 helix-turn-helix domain-containing protein [Streptomyces sp. H10-C2]